MCIIKAIFHLLKWQLSEADRDHSAADENPIGYGKKKRKKKKKKSNENPISRVIMCL